MEVVAEENQEQCLGIQDQASGEVQVSMKAEVSHCHLLAKDRATYRRRNEACTEASCCETTRTVLNNFIRGNLSARH